MPDREHADERAAARDDLLEQPRVARGIRDVDAAAEHDGRRAAAGERAAMRRTVDAERAARHDVDAALGEVLARSRGRASIRTRVAARAPTIATAGPSRSAPRTWSGAVPAAAR